MEIFPNPNKYPIPTPVNAYPGSSTKESSGTRLARQHMSEPDADFLSDQISNEMPYNNRNF
jgi:hypothetical protein